MGLGGYGLGMDGAGGGKNPLQNGWRGDSTAWCGNICGTVTLILRCCEITRGCVADYEEIYNTKIVANYILV